MSEVDPPPAGHAEALTKAYEVWGNPLRESLYGYIRDNPGLFFGEIYAGFRPIAQSITGQNFPTASFSRHLQRLREYGVIHTDMSDERARGRSPRYYPDPESADKLIDALLSEIRSWRTHRGD